MSKYTTLKNKQKLAKALEEIGMTVDEAKQWLAEAVNQQAAQTAHCFNPKHKATSKSCFPEGSLDEQLAFAFWFKEHEDAYAEAATTANYNAVQPSKQPEKDKSNVTFIPGNAQNKPLLLVGGAQVLGDYKACYFFDSNSGKSTLQVEFIDPI